MSQREARYGFVYARWSGVNFATIHCAKTAWTLRSASTSSSSLRSRRVSP